MISLPEYKTLEDTMIYRDGGSLELIYKATDATQYHIFVEVVVQSLDDCKRYQSPMLFQDMFDVNECTNTDSYLGYLSWQQLISLIEVIRRDMKKQDDLTSKERHHQNRRFDYLKQIENIAKHSGWYVDEKR